MPKHYKEMIDEIINKIDEDAPANSVAGGGVDMAPNAKVLKINLKEILWCLLNLLKEKLKRVMTITM